ncbi:subtilisin-like protein [Lactarius quietus]|nr:subtilisin-like protein [Lactarius quietus]
MRHCHWLSMFSVLAAASPANTDTPRAQLWSDRKVKHSWDVLPADWESLGDPPAGATIDLNFALKPYDENALIRALYEVSNPRHSKYGAHLSKEQVAELVAPHPHALELVTSWLNYHGVPSSSISTTHGGGWLSVTDVPVIRANELLGASYQLYQHSGTNDTTILRTASYGLPEVLHKHLKTVVPTTCFASMHSPWQTPHVRSVGAAAELANVTSREMVELSKRAGVKMADVRSIYKTEAYVPTLTDQRNILGIAGYKNQYPSPSDLTFFMSIYRDDAIAATYTVEQINGGGYDQNTPSTEPNIDMQLSQAIAYPIPHIFYSTGGALRSSTKTGKPASGDAFQEWLKHLLAQKNIPRTISTSYGVPEKNLPPEYTAALCDLFMQLGARGVSVLFSTGDNGVGRGDCKDPSGVVRFSPTFPSTCPYVTSVGGTTKQLPEEAAPFSGGGFSNHFPRPEFQDEAVPTFLRKLGDQYAGLYNAAGRGIPDVSAQALNLWFVLKGKEFLASGTSCSVPIVAGIISLLNDCLISNGRKPLGWLNPWLYGDGLAGLTDIVDGNNPGCNTEGFSAVLKWDPVTGLGTPNFLALQSTLNN